ncbi:GNAT family N-acetyltransferase [Candidatus Bathyarchaeota archaeon]|nr:GNAT family N-acetyltransferase [Candidatus Bathyarchaeota archaeon]
MTEVTIRGVEEEDFLEIMKVAAECAPVPLERDSIYHCFTRYFADTCFVAESRSLVVGFILGWISQVESTIAYVHNVCVMPDMRKKGIATRLYDRFIETVKVKGCKEVFLIVNPRNEASLRFHQALGFRISEEGEGIEVNGVRAVKDYNGPAQHMVVMYKTI